MNGLCSEAIGRVDEVIVQKIKRDAVRTEAIWEIETAFFPTPVREKKERLKVQTGSLLCFWAVYEFWN